MITRRGEILIDELNNIAELFKGSWPIDKNFSEQKFRKHILRYLWGGRSKNCENSEFPCPECHAHGHIVDPSGEHDDRTCDSCNGTGEMDPEQFGTEYNEWKSGCLKRVAKYKKMIESEYAWIHFSEGEVVEKKSKKKSEKSKKKSKKKSKSKKKRELHRFTGFVDDIDEPEEES